MNVLDSKGMHWAMPPCWRFEDCSPLLVWGCGARGRKIAALFSCELRVLDLAKQSATLSRVVPITILIAILEIIQKI